MNIQEIDCKYCGMVAKKIEERGYCDCEYDRLFRMNEKEDPESVSFDEIMKELE